MRIKRLLPLIIMPATFLLFSCINNDYDLSDVDTTVEVNVNDLVIPVNLDTITLDAMLDLEDDSRIQKVNGEYAVVEDGTFSSSPINVPSFTAAAPEISPISDDLEVQISSDITNLAKAKTRAAGGQLVFSYDITDSSTDVDISADDVDEAVVSIEHIGVESTVMKVTLAFTGLNNVVDSLEIEDLSFQFMKGLDAKVNIGTYDETTGVIEINNTQIDRKGGYKLTLNVTVNGIGSGSGMELSSDHKFTLFQECKTLTGRIAAYTYNLRSNFFNSDGSLNTEYLLENIPQTISYTCTPVIEDIVVEDFTGQVKYDIDGIDIDPVEMTDIPDVLSQTGTDIKLENPQIYLQLNNPVDSYGLYATAGLQLTSHIGSTTNNYSLDNDLRIDELDNKYCLSPKTPASYYKGMVEGEAVDFSDCTQQTFSTLGNVLSGTKIPETIDINVTDPQIPVQTVTDFRLGEDLDAVEGVYVFYAPLQLTENSQIVYSDTINDWNDEDVDAITISKLVVNADVTTNIPLELEFTAYPIDVNGKKILGSDGNFVVGSVDKAITYGVDESIEITISGTVTHLDGIIFEARVKGTDETDASLQPSQVIRLSNIKAKVSGSYQKEL